MKEKKYLVLGITLVLLTFVGVSLAYFLTTINTKDLRIIFTKVYLQFNITSTDGGYNMTDFKDAPKSEIETDSGC